MKRRKDGNYIMKIYGYCRVSTTKQSIDRQIRNILAAYPMAVIVKEVFRGTKFQGRKQLERILESIQPGDCIVFDSVSRMSRNADEGYSLYEKLYADGVSLCFLKEPHINTETYKKAITTGIPKIGTNVDYILQGVNNYLMALAKEQIRIAFEQSEKEVADLRQRTREGIETARLAGKQIGAIPGRKLITKKSVEAKRIIKRYNSDFGGPLNNRETMKLAGISKNTYYKYKAELAEEMCTLGEQGVLE